MHPYISLDYKILKNNLKKKGTQAVNTFNYYQNYTHAKITYATNFKI